MGVRIRITAGGIYGATGEVPVGTEVDLAEEPLAWAGRYVVLGTTDDKMDAVTGSATESEPEKAVGKKG